MSVRIINADVLDGLAQLEDESVNCCITSPPYWGLRDYGTATWQGGDLGCEHEVINATRTPWANAVPGPNGREKNTVAGHWKPKETGGECAKCGAVKVDNQIGLEATPDAFVAKMVEVFREVKRVLRKDGTLWLNLGDSYASGDIGKSKWTHQPGAAAHQEGRQVRKLQSGTKTKDLVGIPWMTAFALRADGWYLRQEIIWAKPNPMPESVRDRCTKAHEHIFLLTKSERYFYDSDAIADDTDATGPSWAERKAAGEPMRYGLAAAAASGVKRLGTRDGKRNKRSVWTIATQPYVEAHFATFPEELPETCIKAGCPAGGTVLDPFGGAGTTGLVADKLGRHAVLIELNPEYAAMAEKRIFNSAPLFAELEKETPKPAQIRLFE